MSTMERPSSRQQPAYLHSNTRKKRKHRQEDIILHQLRLRRSGRGNEENGGDGKSDEQNLGRETSGEKSGGGSLQAYAVGHGDL